jgi:hypothetical protein
VICLIVDFWAGMFKITNLMDCYLASLGLYLLKAANQITETSAKNKCKIVISKLIDSSPLGKEAVIC